MSKTNTAKATEIAIATHAEEEVRDDLADKKFGHARRRRQQRLDGAALPFARDHERGQERSDHHQDERDGAGHEEAAAFKLGIEPDARLGRDQRLSLEAAAQRALSEPGLPRALHIAVDEACGVRIGAVGDDLHPRRVAARRCAG